MAEIPSGLLPQASMAPVERKSRRARRKRVEVRRRFKCTPEVEDILRREMLARPSVQAAEDAPLFGSAAYCGGRINMEDFVAIHPSFIKPDAEETKPFHYYAVYDGHGCSHVSMRCRERFHDIVKEELETKGWKDDWVKPLEKSFFRMDKEAIAWATDIHSSKDCRCNLKPPDSFGGVGSTAVMAIVTADKIVVANCGDSRAVLYTDGNTVPLSIDQKPDRPDELSRIESIGGRVIYWGGARVLGVLAMSRAIGDVYLKPYVTCVPEISITERKENEDQFLILASDGLWDVVSSEKACGIVRRCLQGRFPGLEEEIMASVEVIGDKRCQFAAMALSKLAMDRGSEDNISVVVVDLRRGRDHINVRGGGGGQE